MKVRKLFLAVAAVAFAAFAEANGVLVDAPEKFPATERKEFVIRQNWDMTRRRYFAFDAYVADLGAIKQS